MGLTTGQKKTRVEFNLTKLIVIDSGSFLKSQSLQLERFPSFDWIVHKRIHFIQMQMQRSIERLQINSKWKRIDYNSKPRLWLGAFDRNTDSSSRWHGSREKITSFASSSLRNRKVWRNLSTVWIFNQLNLEISFLKSHKLSERKS